MDERADRRAPGEERPESALESPDPFPLVEPGGADLPASWIALPVGRTDDGPTIAELVEAVRAAGGMVGGAALFDPRYEPEMRRFLIRALEMEGLPIPRGGDRP